MKHPPKVRTKAWQRRLLDLLPRGVPRWVRIYDNGGTEAPDGSIDRYTVVFTGRYRSHGEQFQYLAMNGAPFHPQGFCQHGESPDQIDVTGSSWAGPSIGKRCHLGLRIPFDTLPHDCQIVVLRDYCDLWDIELPEGANAFSFWVHDCSCGDEFSNRYELFLHMTRCSCGRNSVYSEIIFEPVLQA